MHRHPRTRRLVLAALVATLVPAAALAEPAFAPLRTTRDGIAVSRRPGRTDGFHELRLTARSPVPPDRLEAFVWSSFLRARPPVTRRDFLARRADEIVFHDRVSTPVVSDREYTMRIRRVGDGRTLRLVFGTAPELGPPPTPGFVTLPIVRGEWAFAPDGDGSAVTYTVYSEPGGSIPAFVVRGTLVDEAIDDFRWVMAHAATGQSASDAPRE